jgi:hypothetical protein
MQKLLKSNQNVEKAKLRDQSETLTHAMAGRKRKNA